VFGMGKRGSGKCRTKEGENVGEGERQELRVKVKHGEARLKLRPERKGGDVLKRKVYTVKEEWRAMTHSTKRNSARLNTKNGGGR